MLPVFLDALWGFVAFIGVLAVSFITRQSQDIRSFAIAVYLLFFLAAAYRTDAGRDRKWLTPFTVATGGIVPVAIMAQMKIAFTAEAFLISFLIFSVCAAASGASSKILYVTSKKTYAWAAGVLALITFLVIVFVAIPQLEENAAYDQVDLEVKPFTIQTLDGEAVAIESMEGARRGSFILGHVVYTLSGGTAPNRCSSKEVSEQPESSGLRVEFRESWRYPVESAGLPHPKGVNGDPCNRHLWSQFKGRYMGAGSHKLRGE